MELETLQVIAILAGITALISLGVALWAYSKARRRPAVVEERRTDGVHDLETVQEKYSLLSDRFDRHERTLNSLRDEVSKFRSEVAPRGERIADLEKAIREQQEQIFELREEEKVLMQREDRLERQQQELQEEWMAHRQKVRSRGDGS